MKSPSFDDAIIDLFPVFVERQPGYDQLISSRRAQPTGHDQWARLRSGILRAPAFTGLTMLIARQSPLPEGVRAVEMRLPLCAIRKPEDESVDIAVTILAMRVRNK